MGVQSAVKNRAYINSKLMVKTKAKKQGNKKTRKRQIEKTQGNLEIVICVIL